MVAKKTRVLIVDDSLFMRRFMRDVLEKDGGIEVVGLAADHEEAFDALLKLRPDVMTLDVEMPKMNGIEFLKMLMPQHPLPVLVVSSAPNVVLDAMQAGAVDFVAKPRAMSENERNAFVSELLIKIKIASIARVGKFKSRPESPRPVVQSSPSVSVLPGASCNRIIAIGASTGGTEAIAELLTALKSVQAGIVIVQHMPPVFTRMYAERMNGACALEVREACDGYALAPGRALIAPGGLQMELEKFGDGYRVRCYEGEKVSGHCPSVNVLFRSVAKAAGAQAMGVILTGMGGDGAEGLLAMRQAGAYTVGQNKESCVVYGMPSVAYNLGAVVKELPLPEIPQSIQRWLAQTAARQ